MSVAGITVFLIVFKYLYKRQFCMVTCSSIFANDGNGIVVKRLNSDEADSDDESVASSSGRSSTDAPLAKVPRTSDSQKPSDLLIGVCSIL